MPTRELPIRPRNVAQTSHGIQRVKGWVLRQVSSQSDAVKRLPYPIGHDGIGASSYPVQRFVPSVSIVCLYCERVCLCVSAS